MKQLSYWARRHPWRARICIIILYTPFNITGLITGDLLYSLGVQLPGSFLVTAMALFIVTTYHYPYKHENNQTCKASFYLRRKAGDFLLITATFLMVCFTGNQTNVAAPFYPLATEIAGYAPLPSNSSYKEGIVPGTNGPVVKSMHKKAVRKQLRQLIQAFRRSYKNKPDAQKIVLIALTLVVATSLVLFIFLLSCSLACSGAEALSYVVFFGGTLGIAFLTYFILHRIIKGRPPAKPGTATPAGTQ